MPSTDIDGSPVIILGERQASVIADMALNSWWCLWYGREIDECVQRFAETFPNLEWPDRKFCNEN